MPSVPGGGAREPAGVRAAVVFGRAETRTPRAPQVAPVTANCHLPGEWPVSQFCTVERGGCLADAATGGALVLFPSRAFGGPGNAGRDSTPVFTSTPRPYPGPVPAVVHLHGGHGLEDSDGYPEAWFLPAAKNIPSGFAKVGTYYDRFRAEFAGRTGIHWRPGSATFQYANDQRAATF